MSVTSPAERVAGEVRAALAREGKAQAFVVEVLGLSQPAVSRRLRGELAFDVDELSRIAAALGVSLATLIPEDTAAAS